MHRLEALASDTIISVCTGHIAIGNPKHLTTPNVSSNEDSVAELDVHEDSKRRSPIDPLNTKSNRCQ